MISRQDIQEGRYLFSAMVEQGCSLTSMAYELLDKFSGGHCMPHCTNPVSQMTSHSGNDLIVNAVRCKPQDERKLYGLSKS
jgi:hypothetical protein